MFHHQIGHQEKALQLLSHAAKCYRDWGATAVAKRVEGLVAKLIGSDSNLDAKDCAELEQILGAGKGSSQKRGLG